MFRTVSVASGEVTRTFACEVCGCQYQFKLKRYGLGSGRLGLISASGAAERDVESALKKAIGMVACPDCGHYQKKMIRARRWFWIKWAIAFAFIVPVGYYATGAFAQTSRSPEVCKLVQQWFLLAGIPLIAFGIVMAAMDNPNQMPALRLLNRKQPRRLRPGRPVQKPVEAVSRRDQFVRSNAVPSEQDLPPDFSLESFGTAPPSNDPVAVACSHCGKRYRVLPSKIGSTAKCKACGKKFTL